MAKLAKDSLIKVGLEEVTVEHMLQAIIYLPAQKMTDFFADIELKMAKDVRTSALRKAMNEKVVLLRKQRSHLGDELSHRLEKYEDYTETQLEKLLVYFADEKTNQQFFTEFWLNIISYMVEKKVKPKTMSNLLELGIKHQKTHGQKLPEIAEYNKGISGVFFDEYFSLDGLETDTLRVVLSNSSTLEEIKEIGLKYNVIVPRRLKKKEFVGIVINELKRRKNYSKELETKIRSMPVRDIIRFNIDNGIKTAIDLKAEDMIEYILLNAQKTKEEAFIPGKKELGSISELDLAVLKYILSTLAVVFIIGMIVSIVFLLFPSFGV